MAQSSPLAVVLCWHMHQPQYRDLISGQYQLPWTYLHAIRDYVDMAEHLENCPAARAVVNFTPILLDQIDDYVNQIEGFLANGIAIRDPILEALDMAVLPSDPQNRIGLIKACLRANETRVIDRFPEYRRLAEIARWIADKHGSSEYLNNQFLADLVTWYHLGWLAETVRHSHPLVRRLQEKGAGFTLHERRELLQLVGELLKSVVDRYARLAAGGKVELSCSAYAHPILPLMIDLSAAKGAMPDVQMPFLERYSGGHERAKAQIDHGRSVFEKHFGSMPPGFWPPEGGISNAVIDVLANSGVAWSATGQQVLFNSLTHAGRHPDGNDKAWLHRLYEDRKTGIKIYFRDDGLSDLIGFTYSDWHAEDAVSDLVARLEKIADGYGDCSNRVVSIIMDGENAWEHYPENATHFLSSLYDRLTKNPRLALTTFNEYMQTHEAEPIDELVPGSWVYGSFSTWIGDEEKNRAWDILGDAKRAWDDVMATGEIDPERRARLETQLAVCEGSDWFWWLGEYNPSATVSDFERLFRLHISNLYKLLHREPPEYLAQTLSHGHGKPTKGGVMRTGSEPGG